MKRVIFQIGVTWWRRVSTLALFFVVVIEIAIVALPFLDLKRGIEAQERDDALVAQKLNQIEFMYEFIRELGAIDSIQQENKRGQIRFGSNSRYAIEATIVAANAMNIEMIKNISSIEKLMFTASNQSLILDLKTLYRQRYSANAELLEVCTNLLSDQVSRDEPDDASTDRVSRILGELAVIDERIRSDITPRVIWAITDDNIHDGSSDRNRLLITTAQQEQLLALLQSFFGERLNQETRSPILKSAQLIKLSLTEVFKTADASD